MTMNKTKLNILVACEESQIVTNEFRKLGHNAYSCDLLFPTGKHIEWHIKDDVRSILNSKNGIGFSTLDGAAHYVKKWDLIIAHPPCTYLSNAGARWLYQNKQLNLDRYHLGLQGKALFYDIYYCDCDHIAIENPTPSKIYNLPKAAQIIQPYMFGENWRKRTCLWLKNLPELQPTKIVDDFKPYIYSGTYTKTRDRNYIGFSRKGGSSKSRSKTFPGIAQAMALQWSEYLLGVL